MMYGFGTMLLKERPGHAKPGHDRQGLTSRNDDTFAEPGGRRC
jgi:hypothetical protein